MLKHGHRPCLQNLEAKIVEDGKGRICMKNYKGLLRFARNDGENWTIYDLVSQCQKGFA